MKISKEQLKEIIKEELEKLSEQDESDTPQQKSFGFDTTSQSDRKKDLQQKYKDASKQKGVDSKERGIVQRIEQKLTKLADLTDIKSGSTFTLLKKLDALMEKEIQKLEGKK